MGVKLSLRLEDAQGELMDLKQAARDNGESVRVRDLDTCIRAVEDAIELFKELERAAAPMRELLLYVRD